MRYSAHADRYAKIRIVVEVLVPERDPLFRQERMTPGTNTVHSIRALDYAMNSDGPTREPYKLLSAKRTRVVSRDLNKDGYAVITPGPEDSDDCEADATDRDDRALLGDDHDDPADDGFSDAIPASLVPPLSIPAAEAKSWDFVIA
jgi:hypothetical protein